MIKEAYNLPVYAIGVAAKLLNVCPATLRIWEQKGLIKPKRVGKNRLYSRCDMDRLESIKDLLQKKHINIEGVKNLITTTKCWEIKNCNSKERDICPVYLKYGHA